MSRRVDCRGEVKDISLREVYSRMFGRGRGIAACGGYVIVNDRFPIDLIPHPRAIGYRSRYSGRKYPYVSDVANSQAFANEQTDWALYETFKKAVIPNYNPYKSTAQAKGDGATEVQLATRYAATSAAAMSLSAIVTNPIEIVRTRWQTSGGDVNRPISMTALIREMWRQAGWRAFMRGSVVRGIYYIPSNVRIRRWGHFEMSADCFFYRRFR
ncbi:hypothetical protein FRB91_005215 [Serendipita sp. 411]|nr:hypothetical protein FRB91_005215 [Serendipita sp. 411]